MENLKLFNAEIINFNFNKKNNRFNLRIFKKGSKNNNTKNKIIILVCLIIDLYYLYKNILKNDIKVCLCVISKNENLYAREFVENYKKIGYSKIFIYDNNDKSGEHFEEVINDYIQNGFVKIINFRDQFENPRQIEAYRDCYSKNYKTYNWLSFYDMDEFLEINENYSSIKELLNDKIFEHCLNIKINWLMSINDNILYLENKPLQQRIKTFKYDHPSNKHIKSTVKGNLPVNYWEIAYNSHTSSLNITSCSSSGKIISSDSPFNQPPDFTNAKLKHYYYKSFEEFCIKLKRGKADVTKNINDQNSLNLYNKIYSENKNNVEKLKIIDKIFNDSIFLNSKINISSNS